MNRWHRLPLEVYALVEREPESVLLENARGNSPKPTSRLFFKPQQVLEASEPAQIPDLFEEIERAIGKGQVAAGFFAYECGQAFEPKAGLPEPKLDWPLAWFGVYEQAFVYDHELGAFCGPEPPGLADFGVPVVESLSRRAQIPLQPHKSEEDFAAQIAAIHEWIRAGDVYQLNFTFPMRASYCGGAAALFRAALQSQPVDYGAFLHWRKGRHILSISPELFFSIEQSEAGRIITTRPMKGTAPRGRTTAEDTEIAGQLRNDNKNRSENVMIVDLVRNDLGRLCQFGSVRAEELFAVERYPTVWQMTSTVTGLLRGDAGFYDIFRALFPCGSVTGAPKVRAMQLLAQLEGRARGVYTGAIGYFSRGRTVFNVAIRTLELDCGNVEMSVGSGIVIDSEAAGEYRECLLKAEFLTRDDDPFSLVETILWSGDFPLIELHLDRLLDSADYFGFPCQREKVKLALFAAAASFDGRQPRKVRLLLDRDGNMRFDHQALDPEPALLHPTARVCIAAERTDPRDRFLYHKTTHRPLYASAFKAAVDAGFDDVLFLNRQQQVTEGAISNLFVENSGGWMTPPVACGLLPGVYRRHLLAMRGDIKERVITLDDLGSADAIYLSNAVRGLRRAIIDWEAK